MSRHRLAHVSEPTKYFIVGYDRPVGAYFVQVWDSEADDDIPLFEDDCFDPSMLVSMGAKVPEGLREILVKEACGKSDTNVCKDWK